MLELDVRIAKPRSEEVTVNTAADDGECPGERESRSDDARRSPRNSRRILVVDDTAVTREMYALHFRSRGFSVETVSDGRAAIDAAHRLHPDVIIMDFAMPNLDGISATREIKRDPETADIPVLILTAYPIRAIKGGALDTGARFVMKPCAPEDLEEEVSTVLEGRCA